MVAAEQKKVFRIFNFVREEEQDRLDGLLAAVNIVAEEQVVRVRRVSALLKVTYLNRSRNVIKGRNTIWQQFMIHLMGLSRPLYV